MSGFNLNVHWALCRMSAQRGNASGLEGAACRSGKWPQPFDRVQNGRLFVFNFALDEGYVSCMWRATTQNKSELSCAKAQTQTGLVSFSLFLFCFHTHKTLSAADI